MNSTFSGCSVLRIELVGDFENKWSSVYCLRVAEAECLPGRAQLEFFSSQSVALYLNKLLYAAGEGQRFFFYFNLKENLEDTYRIVCHVCTGFLLFLFQGLLFSFCFSY